MSAMWPSTIHCRAQSGSESRAPGTVTGAIDLPSAASTVPHLQQAHGHEGNSRVGATTWRPYNR